MQIPLPPQQPGLPRRSKLRPVKGTGFSPYVND
jgi:hypothetical protein